MAVKRGPFDIELMCLLDSAEIFGANVSILRKFSLDILQRNSIQLKSFKSKISAANGSRNNFIGYCSLPVTFKGVTESILFYIVPSLMQEGYLGIDFWNVFALAPQIIPQISCLELGGENVDENDSLFHDLSPEQNLQLNRTILKFPSCEKLGLGNLLERHINAGDAVPVKSKITLFLLPDKVFEELDRLLALNVVEESNSPWCSRAVTVRKPGKVKRIHIPYSISVVC